MHFRFTTAGESHGKALVTIVEGVFQVVKPESLSPGPNLLPDSLLERGGTIAKLMAVRRDVRLHDRRPQSQGRPVTSVESTVVFIRPCLSGLPRSTLSD